MPSTGIKALFTTIRSTTRRVHLVKDSDYSGKIGALLLGSFMNKAKTTTVSQILQHGPKASRYYDPDPQV